MALVKCKECGEQVSTKATACPNCGAKAPKKTSVFTWLILIVVVLLVYVANQDTTSIGSSPDKKTPVPLKLLSDEDKAAKTLVLVERLKKVPVSDHATNRSLYNTLVELNPEEQKFRDKLALYTQKQKAAEAELVRLENLNKTGIWKIGNYVDDFGESTGTGFISTTIQGTFSNTATQDSALTVRFLISSSADINFKLFEYAGNNPVKDYGSNDEYTVLVRDKDGRRLRLKARNYSDRLSLDKSASKNLHAALLKGGRVQFIVSEVDTPTTQYNFTIPKADFYSNAARKLAE